MIHYHGTPISPVATLMKLSGRHFCVSHADPRDVARCHQIGQSVMLDNGAFSQWKTGRQTDWQGYYTWSEVWLSCPTTWSVIPDEIDGSVDLQDWLIAQWPHGEKGAPVWHMNEPIDRLLRLVDAWPRVCVGSTAAFSRVLSDPWTRRMDEAWNRLSAGRRFLPTVHMLRGMAASGRRWPFASVDSTDIARNHNRPGNQADRMAEAWDSMQSPTRWHARPEQMELMA